MPTSDPLDILLAHDRWATRNLLEVCAKLTLEQFHQTFEMGPGSLHDSMTHILGAMRGWADLLAGREVRFRLDEARRSPEELIELHGGIADEFSTLAKAHDAAETVTSELGGKSYTFTRGGVLTHVTTHAMHHRAQCLNMMRHLGVDPLPPNSVLEWMLMGEK